MCDLEDHELLKKLKNPETSSYGFNLLVRKYQERLYWHIRRLVVDHDDTDDVLQNTFIKIWKNIGQFREDANLFTWMYRIATNESFTFLKKKKKRFFLPIGDAQEYLLDSLKSDVNYDGEEIQQKLQMAIIKLPDKQRAVFNMKYYEDLKYDEISEILDTSVGALKASYHHAVKKIEKILTSD